MPLHTQLFNLHPRISNDHYTSRTDPSSARENRREDTFIHTHTRHAFPTVPLIDPKNRRRVYSPETRNFPERERVLIVARVSPERLYYSRIPQDDGTASADAAVIKDRLMHFFVYRRGVEERTSGAVFTRGLYLATKTKCRVTIYFSDCEVEMWKYLAGGKYKES